MDDLVVFVDLSNYSRPTGLVDRQIYLRRRMTVPALPLVSPLSGPSHRILMQTPTVGSVIQVYRGTLGFCRGNRLSMTHSH